MSWKTPLILGLGLFAAHLAGAQGSVCPCMWEDALVQVVKQVAEPPAQPVAKPLATPDANVGNAREEAVQVHRRKKKKKRKRVRRLRRNKKKHYSGACPEW